MKFFKKYLLVFTILLSSSVMGIETSPYVAPNSCQSIVEAGKKLAMDDTSGFSSPSTLQDFVACNLEVLPTSLSTDIMYSIFGKSVLTPLSQVNTFVKAVYTNGDKISVPEINVIDLEKNLEKRVKTFPVLIATIEALTFASFQLISFMLGAFSLFYLVNTMSEGTYMGRQVNTFWTFMKMAGAMSLIFPLDGLGLNIIQLVIIFIAFCGSLLASLIWSILPLFKYAYLTEFTNVDEDLKVTKDAKTIEIAEYLVTSSLCDISSRQAVLLKGKSVETFNENFLSTNEMFTCLKKTTPSTIKGSGKYSFEHNKTMECAKERGVEHAVDCGSIVYGETHSEELKKNISTTLYDIARKIAKKSIGANCAKNDILKKGDPSTYYTYCSDIDNISFGTNYKGTPILSLLSQMDYSSDDYKADLLQLQSSLDSELMKNLSVSMIESEDISEKLMKKISFALNKGWFNAGTFLFDIGDSTTIKNVEYETIMTGLDYEIPTPRKPSLKDSKGSGGNYYSADISYSVKLEAKYEEYVAKGNVEAISSRNDLINIFAINEDLNSLGLQEVFLEYRDIVIDYTEELALQNEEKSITKVNAILFPTLLLGMKFNEPELGSKESCAKDYNNCRKMPINPIATIIDTSRESAASTGLIIMVTGIASMVMTNHDKTTQRLAKKAQKKKMSYAPNHTTGMMVMRSANLILEFFNLFLSINLLISIIAGYMLPIVLFIYFVGNALSWILSLVLSVVGATLWMGLHLMPSKEEGFAGHAKKGYLMIMDVFLKPVFLVLGVFGAFILSTILIVVFNATFEIVMSTFAFFDAPKSVIELFYNFLLNFIYVVFLIIIFFRSAKAVYKIPNALETWIGIIAYDDASMWKEVTNLVQKTFLSGMKKFLIFS